MELAKGRLLEMAGGLREVVKRLPKMAGGLLESGQKVLKSCRMAIKKWSEEYCGKVVGGLTGSPEGCQKSSKVVVG